MIFSFLKYHLVNDSMLKVPVSHHLGLHDEINSFMSLVYPSSRRLTAVSNALDAHVLLMISVESDTSDSLVRSFPFVYVHSLPQEGRIKRRR